MTSSMNADVLVKLTLIRKPEQRNKSTCGVCTFARGREGNVEGARFWSFLLFGENARAELDWLEAGDSVSVANQIDAQRWEGRISLKFNVDRAFALRSPPRARKPKGEREAAPMGPNYGENRENVLDDPLPFWSRARDGRLQLKFAPWRICCLTS